MCAHKHPRLYSLDYLKGIAACLVVFMHAKFPGVVGEVIATYGRLAVPVFFLTAGYFSYNNSKEKTRTQIRRTLKYILIAYVLNILRLLFSFEFDVARLVSYIKDEVFALSHLVRFITIQETIISGVAWFLWALLSCYVIKYVIGDRFRYIGYFGLIIGVLASLVFKTFIMKGIPINNSFICGLPFFTIGHNLHSRLDDVKTISNRILVLCILIGFVFIAVSIYNNNYLWHFGTILLSTSLFIIAISRNIKYSRFTLLGSKYAFLIYILHPIIMHIFNSSSTYLPTYLPTTINVLVKTYNYSYSYNSVHCHLL